MVPTCGTGLSKGKETDMHYPREIYSIREDVTRENMRRYDAWQDRVYAEFYKRYPNARQMNLRERYDAIKSIESEIGGYR